MQSPGMIISMQCPNCQGLQPLPRDPPDLATFDVSTANEEAAQRVALVLPAKGFLL